MTHDTSSLMNKRDTSPLAQFQILTTLTRDHQLAECGPDPDPDPRFVIYVLQFVMSNLYLEITLLPLYSPVFRWHLLSRSELNFYSTHLNRKKSHAKVKPNLCWCEETFRLHGHLCFVMRFLSILF